MPSRGAASIGAGSAGFDLVYDPAGRNGQATLTATASRVSLEDLSGLLGLDLGVKDAVADIDLRLRGAGRSTRKRALNVASGSVRLRGRPRETWPARRHGRLAGRDAAALLGGNDNGVPFNCIGGRFEMRRRRGLSPSPRGRHVAHRDRRRRFPPSPQRELGDGPGARGARCPGRATGPRRSGSRVARASRTAGALEPGLTKLIIGAGTVPSLTGTLNMIARQQGVNACATMAPRVERACGPACAPSCRRPRPKCAAHAGRAAPGPEAAERPVAPLVPARPGRVSPAAD